MDEKYLKEAFGATDMDLASVEAKVARSYAVHCIKVSVSAFEYICKAHGSFLGHAEMLSEFISEADKIVEYIEKMKEETKLNLMLLDVDHDKRS